MRSRTAILSVLLILSAGCGREGAAPSSPASAITAAEAEAILEHVILPASDPPKGTRHVELATGVDALGRPFDQHIAAEWALVGFVDARLSAFMGADGDGLVGSWAAVYEDEAAATTAFASYEELFTAAGPYGFDFPSPEALSLGEGGWSYASDGNAGCRPKAAYLWRSGPVVMHVLTCGRAEGRLIAAVAEAMADAA